MFGGYPEDRIMILEGEIYVRIAKFWVRRWEPKFRRWSSLHWG